MICHPEGTVFLLINDDQGFNGDKKYIFLYYSVYKDLCVIKTFSKVSAKAYSYQVAVPTYDTLEKDYTSNKNEKDHLSAYFDEIIKKGSQNERGTCLYCLSLPPTHYNLEDNLDIPCDEEILLLYIYKYILDVKQKQRKLKRINLVLLQKEIQQK